MDAIDAGLRVEVREDRGDNEVLAVWDGTELVGGPVALIKPDTAGDWCRYAQRVAEGVEFGWMRR